MIGPVDRLDVEEAVLTLTIEPCCLAYDADDSRIIRVSLGGAPVCHVEGRFDGLATWAASRSLSTDEVRWFSDLGGAASVSLLAHPTFGCDGEWLTLAIDSGGDTTLSLRWWCELPQEWQPVSRIVQMMELLGEELAADSSGGRELGGKP